MDYYRLQASFTDLEQLCVYYSRTKNTYSKQSKLLRTIFVSESIPKYCYNIKNFETNFLMCCSIASKNLVDLLPQMNYLVIQNISTKTDIICKKGAKNYGLCASEYEEFAGKYDYRLQSYFFRHHRKKEPPYVWMMPLEIEKFHCVRYDVNSITDVKTLEWQDNWQIIVQNEQEQYHVRHYDLF